MTGPNTFKYLSQVHKTTKRSQKHLTNRTSAWALRNLAKNSHKSKHLHQSHERTRNSSEILSCLGCSALFGIPSNKDRCFRMRVVCPLQCWKHGDAMRFSPGLSPRLWGRVVPRCLAFAELDLLAFLLQLGCCFRADLTAWHSPSHVLKHWSKMYVRFLLMLLTQKIWPAMASRLANDALKWILKVGK